MQEATRLKLLDVQERITKVNELFVPTVYPDKDGSLVIGYGHTNNLGTAPTVVPGMTVTEAEATDILRNDLSHVGQQVMIVCDGLGLTECQFNAFCDIAFNRGIGRLRDSQPLYFMRHPEMKHYTGHAARAIVVRSMDINPDTGKEFSKLNWAVDLELPKIDGKPQSREYLGLTLRRIDNAALFKAKPGVWF